MVKKSSQNKTLSFLSLENRLEEGKPIVSNFKLTCCSVEKNLRLIKQCSKSRRIKIKFHTDCVKWNLIRSTTVDGLKLVTKMDVDDLISMLSFEHCLTLI